MAYLNLTGNSGSRATAPDSAVLDIPGDMDLIIDLHADWTNIAAWDFITKHEGAADASFWFDNNNGDGTFNRTRIRFYDSGGTERIIASPSVSGHDLGDERAKLRVFLDVDDGAGGSTAHFYFRRPSDGSWTSMGTNNAATTTGAIRTGTAIVAIGGRVSFASLLVAKVYRAQIWSGDSESGGTLVFDADPEDPTTWTYA